MWLYSNIQECTIKSVKLVCIQLKCFTLLIVCVCAAAAPPTGGTPSGIGSMFGEPSTQNLMQQMMQNPQLMMNMMQAPYMQQVMQTLSSNPQLMQQVHHRCFHNCQQHDTYRIIVHDQQCDR